MITKLPPSYRMALYVQEDRHHEEQVDSLLAQLQMLRTEAKWLKQNTRIGRQPMPLRKQLAPMWHFLKNFERLRARIDN